MTCSVASCGADPEAIIKTVLDDNFDPTEKKSVKVSERLISRVNRDLKDVEPKTI